MEKLEVTWPIALKVWWSFFWRIFLLSLIMGPVIGGTIALIGKLFGIPFAVINVIGLFSGGILAIVTQVFIMKKILNKKYKSFSVALIPHKD